jgi:hypothetical protein
MVADSIQLWAVLIVTSNQQRDTERSRHDALLAISTLAESQREIANRLGARFDTQWLVVVEGVVLTLDARVLDHGPRIGLQTRHGTSDVVVDLDDLFDRRSFQQRRGHALLDADNDTVSGSDLMGWLWSVVVVVVGCGGGIGRHTPIAVEPSLMASKEYSTWKRRPSGEKVLRRVSDIGLVSSDGWKTLLDTAI